MTLKRFVTCACLPLVLAACAQASSLETGIAPNASFNALQVTDAVFASPRQVMGYYLAPLGRDHADEKEVGNYPGGAGDRLLVFSVNGLEDDSVSGQQFRVLLAQTDMGFRVVSAGERYRCARGNINAWTTSLCP